MFLNHTFRDCIRLFHVWNTVLFTVLNLVTGMKTNLNLHNTTQHAGI